jgi:hypothetical protein
MLDSLLTASYGLAVAAMAYNTAKIKFQDDFEREVRDYREYDYANETLSREKLEGAATKCVILAKYQDHQIAEAKRMDDAEGGKVTDSDGSNPSTEDKSSSPEPKETARQVLFQRSIAFFNVTDPARLFTAKLSKDEEFSLLFDNVEKNKECPLEVRFGRGS